MYSTNSPFISESYVFPHVSDINLDGPTFADPYADLVDEEDDSSDCESEISTTSIWGMSDTVRSVRRMVLVREI